MLVPESDAKGFGRVERVNLGWIMLAGERVFAAIEIDDAVEARGAKEGLGDRNCLGIFGPP